MCSIVNNSGCDKNTSWQVNSPDGNIIVTVLQVDGSKEGLVSGRLYYKVECGFKGERKEAVGYSPLGIERRDTCFVDGLIFDSAGAVVSIDETYSMVSGKRSHCENRANELRLGFRNVGGGKMELVIRAYNEAAAFRYVFPERGEGEFTVKNEISGFRLDAEFEGWMQPYDNPGMFTPAYEAYHEKVKGFKPAEGGKGWCFPALFHLKENGLWMLITETGLEKSYCGCHLSADTSAGLYRIAFPAAGEGNNVGAVEPSWSLPWEMPWRVIMVSESIGNIIESDVVTDLSNASVVKDTSWIKPGRVSWSWWSDTSSPKDYNKLKNFIDLAAEMGWEYSLVDANWNRMENGDIHKLLNYAKAKGVGLLLWYNSAGAHNKVTEEPRDLMDSRDKRKQEFAKLQQWGVKGIKIDFFGSDKQNIIKLYHEIMEDAADYKLMVNFHGCTVPRGWSRTYPHLMSMEAVRGAENYINDPQFPDKAPANNTALVFTRNVVGPMDYTPVAFSDQKNNGFLKNNSHKTTNACELAFSVVYECGLVHFVDKADEYKSLPSAPKEFLKAVRTAWDDTKFIAGKPGEYVVIARRKGNDWFIGGINGENKERNMKIALDFIDKENYSMVLISDGENNRSFKSSRGEVKQPDVIEAKLVGFGGFVVHLSAK